VQKLDVGFVAPRYQNLLLPADKIREYRVADQHITPYGEWLNWDGYHLGHKGQRRYFLFLYEDLWEVTLDTVFPLTWRDSDGYHQCAWYTAETNLGSVPPPFDRIVSRASRPRSFIFHDFFCETLGSFHSDTFEGPYRFKRFGGSSYDRRKIADRKLSNMFGAEAYVQGSQTAGKILRHPVYGGVRIGALWQKDPVTPEEYSCVKQQIVVCS
jgi:hypothetical protein